MKIETAPLRGYLVKETDAEVWIEDRHGTWIVKKSDIVCTADWEGAKANVTGKPVLINIRDKAVIHEIRPMKINLSAKPITLGDVDKMPEIKGNKQLVALARCWTRNLGFSPKSQAERKLSIIPTTCCYLTGEWGVDCPADDCGQELRG